MSTGSENRPVITVDKIRENLDAIPRVRWSHIPTPLEDWTKLAERLGGPRILVKRDDATGLAYGGNKSRHFEFEMAHVLEGGFDTLININNFHSNQARVAAAGCVKAGIRYLLVSTGEVDRPIQGNLLLVKLMGGEIHRIPESDDASAYARSLADKVRSEGGNPYILNEDSFPEIMGAIAFIEAGLELKEQLDAIGVNRVHLWGLTGRSLPALKMFSKNLVLDWSATVVKYSPSDDEALRETMVARSRQAAELLKLPVTLEPDDVEILDGFSGPAYAAPTDAAFEAIHLVAQTEAVILDPNYTGKSMSGLIDQIRKGRFGKDDTIMFLHSGGLPQVFAFNEELAAWDG
ncbi:MAG: pyridoxal-phosphate dependent enzyme [Chloroflexi bacterium]|nr:pyridoxal-phosphate dependent enzyme [Chloroflexota bacterium]